MEVTLTKNALKDLKYWQKTKNIQVQKRISVLVNDIAKNPYEGIGKPEKLRNNLTGCWSRRITKEHRLVYRTEDDKIIILALRYHY